ncbi:hypothetical protein ACIQMR_05605 [Streptomyces sp. NPDC091376]|uniref:hypothetical protein n=1 Tax=Streptomyces sp. NPDC091376 TaxID=3365994 RepID=UPI00380302AF
MRATNRTVRTPGEAAAGEGTPRRRAPWASALANLVLGVPALAPLYCVQWLLIEYLPMDCRSSADVPVATNCDYQTLDHAGPMMMLLLLTGVFVLALAVLVNLALPLAPGRRLRSCLGAAGLLLVPYAVLWALYLSGVGTP